MSCRACTTSARCWKSRAKRSHHYRFVRALNVMLKNKSIKDRLVPIIADEARTFGMEGLFRQIGIYSPTVSSTPRRTASRLLTIKKTRKVRSAGRDQRAGRRLFLLAAATSHSTNNLPMIPFYIYYSMFGFQRIGDLRWAAATSKRVAS
ncbi:hypothetical protein ACNKHM_07140 [Shigella sonnei]